MKNRLNLRKEQREKERGGGGKSSSSLQNACQQSAPGTAITLHLWREVDLTIQAETLHLQKPLQLISPSLCETLHPTLTANIKYQQDFLNPIMKEYSTPASMYYTPFQIPISLFYSCYSSVYSIDINTCFKTHKLNENRHISTQIHLFLTIA